MTAALATAFFLSVAWLIVVAIAATLDGKVGRIGDALAGRVPPPVAPVMARYSLRYSLRRSQRAVMRPRLRAAA